MCHSIPVKSVENDKVAGSCLSEPLKEEPHQSHESGPEEEQAATAGGEDSVSKADAAARGDVGSDQDNVETGAKEVGDARKVPEETFVAENESSQAVSVSKQGGTGETVGSEMGSKKGEDEKTEESAAADSALKESSSVEGDDQKKRFVVFCILETTMVYLYCFGPFVLAKCGCFLEVKMLFTCVCSCHS